MTEIEKRVLDAFHREMREDKAIPEELANQMHEMLSRDKRPKPEELAKHIQSKTERDEL